MEKENLGHAKWKRQDRHLGGWFEYKNMKQVIGNCGEALKRYSLKMTIHDHTKKNQKHEEKNATSYY